MLFTHFYQYCLLQTDNTECELCQDLDHKTQCESYYLLDCVKSVPRQELEHNSSRCMIPYIKPVLGILVCTPFFFKPITNQVLLNRLYYLFLERNFKLDFCRI